jgi:hypothetical protein
MVENVLVKYEPSYIADFDPDIAEGGRRGGGNELSCLDSLNPLHHIYLKFHKDTNYFSLGVKSFIFHFILKYN